MDLTNMISGGAGEEKTPQQQLSKEEYAAMKKQQREEVWAEVDAQAQAVFQNGDSLKGFLDFTFVENRGAAFGILSGRRVFFIVLTVIVAIGIVYSFYKLPKTKEYYYLKCGLLLVLSGAFGNVIDRMIRGYVVDFLEITFIKWPVFNLADIYVVIGACLILFLSLFVIKEDEKKET